jgi:hypothetical protein
MITLNLAGYNQTAVLSAAVASHSKQLKHAQSMNRFDTPTPAMQFCYSLTPYHAHTPLR